MKMANLLSYLKKILSRYYITQVLCTGHTPNSSPRFDLGRTLVNLETDIEMTALILAVVIEVALPCMSWYVH
jgi:hypothetical protein